MPHVFVSYVHEDAGEVNRLCGDLAKYGVEVWLDKDDIKPGARWKDVIRNAIKDGDYFVACFSKAYVSRSSRTKTYMNEELQLALDELRQYGPNRSWFIPVLLSECEVPVIAISARETLQDLQWVELFANWERGITRIIDVIKPIPPEISILIRALASRESAIRAAALKELETNNDPRAVPAVAALLRGDRSEAAEAARLIGRIGGPFAAPVLVEFIRASEPDTRTPPTFDYYDRHEFQTSVRVDAARALSQLRDPAATPFLVEALNDPEYYVRSAAAAALAATRDSSAVPAIMRYLADSHEDRFANAAEALGGIGDRSAVSALLGVLNDGRRDPKERLKAAEAAGRIGDPAAIPALIEAVKTIKSGWDYSVPPVIGRAIKSIGASAALPVLFESLQNAESTICERLVAVLSEIGDPAAVPHLLAVLNNPAEPVHIHVLGNAFGQAGNESAVAPLIAALKDVSARVRRRAAVALEYIVVNGFKELDLLFRRAFNRALDESVPVCALVEPVIHPALLAALHDTDPGVRAFACRALSGIERSWYPPRYFEARKPVFVGLTNLLKREDDKRVQDVLLDQLRRFDAFDERQAVAAIVSKRTVLKREFQFFGLDEDIWGRLDD